MIPDFIIESFYNRIVKLLNQGATSEHPSVKVELDRVLKINGNVIPDKINNLLGLTKGK